MKFSKLGKSGLNVSALGFGCMGLSEGYGVTDLESAKKIIHETYKSGINFFDTADVYGSGENEKLLGEEIKSFRNSIVVATKCGIQKQGNGLVVNNTKEYIKQACHNSLQRLGIDTIDLYYLHRHNPETSIEDAMHTMKELINEGKIRFVGLSEVAAETIERAYKVLGNKLVAVQSEYSIVNHVQAEGVLPTCRKHGIAFVAFSPIARGLLSGKITDTKAINLEPAKDFRSILPQFQADKLKHNLQLVNELTKFAQNKKCTPAQLSLAWLLAKGEDIIPIPGTKNVNYLKENIAAITVSLSQEDLKVLEKIIKSNPVQGERLPEGLMKALHMKG
jgi:aryl-alcohol dehydrogenase-like predicted oxidoreductase